MSYIDDRPPLPPPQVGPSLIVNHNGFSPLVVHSPQQVQETEYYFKTSLPTLLRDCTPSRPLFITSNMKFPTVFFISGLAVGFLAAPFPSTDTRMPVNIPGRDRVL
ncbi:uncharacterized protein BO95DRAFT_429266 [Aspergillus brunneoviolaceus CBS 621.78]|uniref:Uncharacterized protein n=1 Tax=Aspergillus brunneoviolaceus CBS 621.78 TaxID=1450534 RepID=A0ACD1GHA9_9EURO|nr:hypothetical protein BO95DRAFT_429266 [Aspergillus brunneoviolaceus CBS 621.78]RAH48669.1 hypothetical protein BO95DRAFT_429266 [Aspergillus brunneoviolaceus CBS 621.78]